MQCPKCKAIINDGMRFCTKCGHNLTGPMVNQPSIQKVPPVGEQVNIQDYSSESKTPYERAIPPTGNQTNVPPVNPNGGQNMGQNQYEIYQGPQNGFQQNNSQQTVLLHNNQGAGSNQQIFVDGSYIGPNGQRIPAGFVANDPRLGRGNGQNLGQGNGYVDPASVKNTNGDKKKKSWVPVLIICLSLLLVCGLGVGAYFMFFANKDEETSIVSVSPMPTEEIPAPSNEPTPSVEPTPSLEPSPSPEIVVEDVVLNVWSYNDELPNYIEKYISMHPDCGISVNATIIPNENGAYYDNLDNALMVGGSDQPDIYCVDYVYTPKYVKGDMSSYAMSYEELGLDVSELEMIAQGTLNVNDSEKQIAPYTIIDGTNQYGEIVGLNYESTVCLMYYRRSIARDVWGDLQKYAGDSSGLNHKLSSGLNTWDNLIMQGDKLKAKGYAIVSSIEDMWIPYKNMSNSPWVVNGQVVMERHREQFMDDAKLMYDRGYCNKTRPWTDDWYKDMCGEGKRPVLVFVGPSWFLNYTLGINCGDTYGDWGMIEAPSDYIWGSNKIFAGKNMDPNKKEAVSKVIDWMTLDCSENGLQYLLADGEMFGVPTYVPSSAVMHQVDGSMNILGGDNLFESCEWKNSHVNAGVVSEYDNILDSLWMDQVYAYCEGRKSRKQAITDFKSEAQRYVDTHR